MNRPLTKKEWKSSVTKMWESAIESTYRDLIEKAVKAERKALEVELLKLKKGIAGPSDYIQGRWDLIGEFQDVLRARGQS
jgi:hypothetical protein